MTVDIKQDSMLPEFVTTVNLFVIQETSSRGNNLGCGSPVSYQYVYMISANICGEADGGGPARQRQEFKTYMKSTAQVISLEGRLHGLFLVR